MKKILWLVVFVPAFASSQVKYEVQEFTGIVKIIGHRATGLAYEAIEIEVAGKAESFLFRTYYGKLFIDNFKRGDQITVKVNVNVASRARLEQLKDDRTLLFNYRDLFTRDYIVEVKIRNEWVPIHEITEKALAWTSRKSGVFLDQKVKDIYKEDGDAVGLIFENGIIANLGYDKVTRKLIVDIKKGDVVSFAGLKLSGEESAYPIPNVKEVYHFGRLSKYSGVIKSLLYKQNYACIGLVLKAKDVGEVKVSFPSTYAKLVDEFAKKHEEVSIYRSGYSIAGQLNDEELHAIVADGDTLRIDDLWFYGGADGKHDHKPAIVSGKIGKIDRGINNRIISFIVANDVYVDVNAGNMEQIAKYIKKGVQVEIAGDQRIKKEGEIYLKDYRILIPHRIKIDGKEFLLP
ncbi:hypothetical protein BH09BAC3_BH09BAC3_31240 [soil metagenome]